MKHLDLFSGIGGFALAAQTVWGKNYQTVAFCDNEPFCQAILEKHWPDTPIYGDIRQLDFASYVADFGDPGDIDLLTGGFPCQPFSQAGQRRGRADDRHLWPQMLRVIRDFKPRWVIAENVRGLLSQEGGVVFEQVCTDLEREAYDVQAFIIPAAGVGAPHRRDRVWIVANSKSQRRYGPIFSGEREALPRAARPDKDVADANNERHERDRSAWDGGLRLTNAHWTENWSTAAARLCRMDDGLPQRMDRAARIKALGNAIVPQIAAEIMRAIHHAHIVTPNCSCVCHEKFTYLSHGVCCTV